MSIRCCTPAIRLYKLAGSPALLIGRQALPITREYHGDPGPSTRRLSRSRLEKRRLRDTAMGQTGTRSGTGAVGGLDSLNMLLDARPAPRRWADPEGTGTTPPPTPTPGSQSFRSSPEHGTPEGRQRGARFNTAEKPHSSARRFGDLSNSSNSHDRTLSKQDPFETSGRIRAVLDKASSPLTPAQVDQLIGILTTTPANAVNAPVWNLVLAALGRDGKYDRMWKGFNDMKKRGIKPTSRTYTTLLNAYASVPHSGIVSLKHTTSPPEPRTLSRVSIIFAQAQSHIKSRLALSPSSSQNDPEDVGLALPSGQSVETEEVDEEINIGPTNAYLKFLARYGMYRQMETIYLSMDASGVLAPDVITYTTMFHALRAAAHMRGTQAKQPDANSGDRGTGSGASGASGSSGVSPRDEGEIGETVAIGPAARLLWDQVVRRAGQKGSSGHIFEIDNDLAILAVQCLSLGRPEDQRLAIALIPHLWSLPQLADTTVASATSTSTPTSSPASLPGSGSSPSPRILTSDSNANANPSLPSHMSTLPHLSMTFRVASSLLTILIAAQKTTLAAHYAHVLLLRPELRRPERPFLGHAIRAFADVGDVEAVLNVLERRMPDGWGMDIWGDALTAARWAASWDGARDIWLRMTGRSPGKSTMTRGEGKTKTNRDKDRSKSTIVDGKTYDPTAKTMSLLFKVSFNKGNREVQTALDTFESYGVDFFFPATGAWSEEGTRARTRKEDRADVVWKKELAKDVRRAGERLLEKEQDVERRERIGRVLRSVAARS